MEIWKTVYGFDLYEVSTLGQVKNTLTNQILKPAYDRDGYLHVVLYRDNKKKTKKVHRLIGLSFIENPHNLPQIDHINNIKDDNRLENLRWLSNKDNNRRKKTNVGASIYFDKHQNRWKVSYIVNGKLISKRFHIDQYEQAEQFYFEKCGDFDYVR